MSEIGQESRAAREKFRRSMQIANGKLRNFRLAQAAGLTMAAVLAVLLSGCGGGFSMSQGTVAISPSYGQPGQSLTVNIQGTFTQFKQGVTTASFGSGISVGGAAEGEAGPVSVVNETTATASIAIGVNALPGARSVTVTSPDDTDELQDGFTIRDVPIADAGQPQAAPVGTTVQLDGSASRDPGGVTLSYQWTILSAPTGSTSTLIGATTSKPALLLDRIGSFVAQLVVSNGTYSSAPATVTIASQIATPTANAGLPQTVPAGTTVQLDGSASSDPGGLTLSYQWTIVSAPAGSTATLSGATTAKPTIVVDRVGSFNFQLVVSNGTYSSAPATVTINCQIATPTANAGPPQTVPAGTTVQLDGSASTDPGGLPLSYQWTIASAPTGSNAALSGATTAKPTFVVDRVGSFKFQLVVSNGTLSSAPVTVTITSQIATPTANAGLPQTVSSGTTVQLDGSASSDPGGLALTYQWTLVLVPTGIAAALSGANTVNPTFVADKTGSYKAQLVVSNGTLSSAPATVTITSLQPNPTANAGSDQNITLAYGQTTVSVTLDGSGSTAQSGTIVTYAWAGTPTPSVVAKPTVSLTPGSYTFTLIVTDSHGLTSVPSTVHVVVVKETVHPPLIAISTPSPYTTKANGATPLNIALTATSPDGRPVTLTAGPALTNSTFGVHQGTTASGTYTFTPAYGQQGSYLVAFTARDSYGLTASSTVQMSATAVDRPPVLTMQSTATVTEGATLTVPVSASDPDGDVVTLTAAGLPANAVLVPASGAITFSPVSGQARSDPYVVTVTASDGQLSSIAQVSITVNAGSSQSSGGQLTLAVDTPPTPSFLSVQQVTGTVNGQGTAQQPQKSALITGLSPASGRQGTTITVVLTGDTSSYVTHFAAGQSSAQFGSGITVNSLAIADATDATASITIDTAATVGARSVSITTGSETAVSVNAFYVLQGVSKVSGTLVDAGSASPISGATVLLQGTVLTATSGADGTFTLQNVPAGTQTLMVNASNYALSSTSINVAANATLNVGTIKLNPTVFDPAATPSVSLMSLLGRNIGTLTGAISTADAKSAIIDAITLVGGTEMGVLDAYGNQLNPKIAGVGKLSLQNNGANLYAQRMASGETISLMQLLYEMSFAFHWSGTPPTYLQMQNALQTLVNQAWADPYNANSAVLILLFNQGRSLTPDPPTLAADTRLNKFQAYIAISGLMMQMYNQGN